MGWNDREPYASMIERRMTQFAQEDADAAYMAAVEGVVDDMLEAPDEADDQDPHRGDRV